MSKDSYWELRLLDATRKAAETQNPRLRSVYMQLAAHYVSMAKLCSATGLPVTSPGARYAPDLLAGQVAGISS